VHVRPLPRSDPSEDLIPSTRLEPAAISSRMSFLTGTTPDPKPLPQIVSDPHPRRLGEKRHPALRHGIGGDHPSCSMPTRSRRPGPCARSNNETRMGGALLPRAESTTQTYLTQTSNFTLRARCSAMSGLDIDPCAGVASPSNARVLVVTRVAKTRRACGEFVSARYASATFSFIAVPSRSVPEYPHEVCSFRRAAHRDGPTS
jgi:hypothetical protein